MLSHSAMSSFFDPMDIALLAPPSMGFPRQECWRGLHCPPAGDLPESGIETISLKSLYWQAGSLALAPPGKRSVKADIPKTYLKEFP